MFSDTAHGHMLINYCLVEEQKFVKEKLGDSRKLEIDAVVKLTLSRERILLGSSGRIWSKNIAMHGTHCHQLIIVINLAHIIWWLYCLDGAPSITAETL